MYRQRAHRTRLAQAIAYKPGIGAYPPSEQHENLYLRDFTKDNLEKLKHMLHIIYHSVDDKFFKDDQLNVDVYPPQVLNTYDKGTGLEKGHGMSNITETPESINTSFPHHMGEFLRDKIQKHIDSHLKPGGLNFGKSLGPYHDEVIGTPHEMDYHDHMDDFLRNLPRHMDKHVNNVLSNSRVSMLGKFMGKKPSIDPYADNPENLRKAFHDHLLSNAKHPEMMADLSKMVTGHY
jgi:hypothetical protein